MVNNLVFRWPKPLCFMVLGAHGSYRVIFRPFKGNGIVGAWSLVPGGDRVARPFVDHMSLGLDQFFNAFPVILGKRSWLPGIFHVFSVPK